MLCNYLQKLDTLTGEVISIYTGTDTHCRMEVSFVVKRSELSERTLLVCDRHTVDIYKFIFIIFLSSLLKPGMFEGILKSDSFAWVFCQQLREQVFAIVAD